MVPKPSAPWFESQMIEEKLSARNGISATKGVSSVELDGQRVDDLDALLIGPQLALVTLGLAGSKARSIVYFTSFASSGVPSWQFTPSLQREGVSDLPSALTVQDFARFGTGLARSSVASSVS